MQYSVPRIFCFKNQNFIFGELLDLFCLIFMVFKMQDAILKLFNIQDAIIFGYSLLNSIITHLQLQKKTIFNQIT